MMKRFKCYVAYDGYNYVGWQRQANGLSVQEVIEDVIEKIQKRKVNIVASGRTDAKVHALNQCFHFDTDFYLSDKDWKKAINGHLPKDIYINSLEEVDRNFHARFNATNKRYDYLINLGDYDVFKRYRMFQPKYDLDIDLMEECSKIFIGYHDFSSFCSNPYSTHPDQRRYIRSIVFNIENDVLRISYQGKGFLRYMVRMLTATLIEVGRHRISKKELIKMFESKDKGVCRVNAKPYGLYLVRVDYDESYKIDNERAIKESNVK